MSLSIKDNEDDLNDMDLHSMTTLFTNGHLTIVQAANYVQRTQILGSLKKTNYNGFVSNCTSNGGEAFTVSHQTGK